MTREKIEFGAMDDMVIEEIRRRSGYLTAWACSRSAFLDDFVTPDGLGRDTVFVMVRAQ